MTVVLVALSSLTYFFELFRSIGFDPVIANILTFVATVCMAGVIYFWFWYSRTLAVPRLEPQ